MIALLGAALTIDHEGSGHGWWRYLWAHWAWVWSPPLALLETLLVVLAAVAWLGDTRWPDFHGLRLGVAGATGATSLILCLRYRYTVGPTIVGVAAGTSVLLLWTADWLGKRRHGGEGRIASINNGLEEWGTGVLGRPYRAIVRLWHRPHGQYLPSGTHSHGGPELTSKDGKDGELRGRRARLAGAIILLAMWLAAMVAGAELVQAAVHHWWPATEPAVTQPAAEAAGDQPPPPEQGSSRLPSTPKHQTPTTTRPAGSLRCSHAIGEGSQVPGALQSALAAAAVDLAKRFHLCGTGALVERPATGVFDQPFFTNDGEGAVLVAWQAGAAWIVTFVSSDDAAAYVQISATLDWRTLGRPRPFMKCDGVWVQPFEGPNGELVGAGIRDRADAEGREDRPQFVWGAAVASLLAQPDGVLLVPAGPPTADADGPLQYFFDRTRPVRASHTPADRLTIRDLLAHCGP